MCPIATKNAKQLISEIDAEQTRLKESLSDGTVKDTLFGLVTQMVDRQSVDTFICSLATRKVLSELITAYRQ